MSDLNITVSPPLGGAGTSPHQPLYIGGLISQFFARYPRLNLMQLRVFLKATFTDKKD